jgi:endonuclease/exonuclease/phosphatase family metal-dependent hydrolase
MECRSLAALAAAALALGVLAGAGCTAARYGLEEEAPVRVLVFNIHAGRDPAGVDNLRRVADLVLDHRADFVLLQEVDRRTGRSGRVDQLAELAGLTGYHAAFGRTLHFQGGEYGIAVLSRWPIRTDTLIELPVEPTPEREGSYYEARGVQHAWIAAPQGDLHLLNTHLDHVANDGFRRQQIATVIAVANRLRARGDPVLLGGDLNDTPAGAVLAMLRDAGWTDAWVGCGAGEGRTFPSDAPDRRIDYLILPPTLRCDSAAVLDSRASDHRPVLFVVSPRDHRR